MAATTSPTLPAKRKRAQVTYLNDDEELDQLLEMEERDEPLESQDSLDEDPTYGTRKKPKRKGRAVKKSRITSAHRTKRGKPFPFLQLPPELRDHIYELALTDADGLGLVCRTKNYRRTVARSTISDQNHFQYYRGSGPHRPTDAAPSPLIPALLAVNKQIFSEAVGYLYQQPLILQDTYALHSFLAAIGSNRKRVTDITVKTWGDGRGVHKAMNFCSFVLLAECTNLKRFFLDCAIGHGRSPLGLARQLFRDGYHFLSAYGAANGRKDAVLDVLKLNERNYGGSRDGWRYRNAQVPEKSEFQEQFRAELRKLLGC